MPSKPPNKNIKPIRKPSDPSPVQNSKVTGKPVGTSAGKKVAKENKPQTMGSSATAEDVAALTKQREKSDEKLREGKKKKDSGKENSAVKEFLALAMTRFRLAAEAEQEFRKDSLDDLKFATGDQWDGQVRSSRELDGRPCLTINRLPQFIKMITNEQRQQRPAIQINPVGDGADKETARIIQGMTRHIEVNSDAEIPYDTGGESAVTIGFGYWRIIREYLPGLTFDQEIKIKRIKNAFSVYFDPSAQEHDYSDADWAFVITDIPRRSFVKDHPGTIIAGLTNWSSIGDNAPGWASQDTVRVAEYFYTEYEDRMIVYLEDGTVVDKKDWVKGESPKILATRNAPVRRIKWAKITALDALEGGPEAEIAWDGRWIPIVPVLADDLVVNGKRYVAGLVRNAKDPQRMYNFWVSAATEMIALAPKAPYLVAKGQLSEREEMWRQANVRNFAFLEYNPISVGGQIVGPPQRNTVEPPIAAIGSMTKQADNDLKSTTGLYDASLGQRGPDESGKAILARQRQGDVSTLNYSDNLARAIRHTGRIILDLIPSTYDKPRIQRIIKPDQTVEHVGIFNSKGPDEMSQEEAMAELKEMQEKMKLSMQIDRVYDVGIGLYDVTVTVGPSYQSKRQEAVASMMNLVGSYPQLMQAAGDLLLKNMDWPGAQEIAERLKKLLPPQLQDVDSTDPQIKLSALQNQMQAMMQQHDAVVKALNDATETIKMKKLDVESKERIALMQAQVQILVAEAKIQGEAAIKHMDTQMAMITSRLDLLHEGMSIDQELSPPSVAPQGPVPSAPPPMTPPAPPAAPPQVPPQAGG